MRDAAIDRPRAGPRVHAGKAPAKGPAKGPKPAWVSPGRLFGPLRRHGGKTVAIAAMSLLMAGIAGNAILFQRGHHPAPLFGATPMPPAAEASTGSLAPRAPPASQPLAAAEPRSAAEPLAPAEHRAAVEPRAAVGPAPLPPAASRSPAQAHPRPGLAIAKPSTTKPPATKPPTAKPPMASARPVPATRGEDGIGRLLRAGAAAPGVGAPPPAAIDARPSGSDVLAAQKALRKLGYEVEANGRWGAATRQALDKFGQDRHLKAASGLPPKLLHDLERAAGGHPG